MPELNFKGKEFVYNHHLAVPHRPLAPHPEKSIPGSPLPQAGEGQGERENALRLDGNLIIHGDNLHALKSLLPMYAGKVDCVFIDPPITMFDGRNIPPYCHTLSHKAKRGKLCFHNKKPKNCSPKRKRRHERKF